MTCSPSVRASAAVWPTAHTCGSVKVTRGTMPWEATSATSLPRIAAAALRSHADGVLVAAGTVRAEHYGPIGLPIAVVSRSCRLDWDWPLFTATNAQPIVVTVAEAPELERKRAADLADVIIAGERDVDLATAIDALAARGLCRVLAEGGPSLNGQIAAAGLLDELCLTLSPLLVGGDAKRILAGAGLVTGSGWRLHSLCEQDGFLFLRYRPQ